MLRAALRPQHLCLALVVSAALAACPPSTPVEPDAGAPVDAGPDLASCDSPEDCRVGGAPGVCRQGLCRPDVHCTDDVECGLGETCEGGLCRFTGCASDADCVGGLCRLESFSCTECRENADCPDLRPVCTDRGRCVKCQADTDCSYPDSPYCDASSGRCVYCKVDQHCPTGLSCGAGGVCVGAPKGAPCGDGVAACDLGLMCVITGGGQVCLEACTLYNPTCPQGETCVKLTFSQSASLVFEGGAPLGVCFANAGGPGYRETCQTSCRGNLICIPDSSDERTCKAFCDPVAPFCPGGEICHSFPGDWQGHRYGLCYANNGYADPCTGNRDCKPGLVCMPEDDPAAPQRWETYCTFAAPGAEPLTPCTTGAQCQSGECRADAKQGLSAGFCFAACDDDQDCDFGTRKGECALSFEFPMVGTDPNRPDLRGQLDFTNAFLDGCRPRCDSPAACTEYDPGFTCRAELDTAEDEVDTYCGPPLGVKRVGEPCFSNGECREGYCANRDGRGVREGVCTHPCADALDCAAPALSDGGAPASPACGDVVYFIANGPDAVFNTPDDRLASAKVCGGGACTTNADCSGAWSWCVPDRDPANPAGNFVTACRSRRNGPLAAGAACSIDSQCQSGVCGNVAAAPGSRACLHLCTPGGNDCGATLTCVAGGILLDRADGTSQPFDACLP